METPLHTKFISFCEIYLLFKILKEVLSKKLFWSKEFLVMKRNDVIAFIVEVGGKSKIEIESLRFQHNTHIPNALKRPIHLNELWNVSTVVLSLPEPKICVGIRTSWSSVKIEFEFSFYSTKKLQAHTLAHASCVFFTSTIFFLNKEFSIALTNTRTS